MIEIGLYVNIVELQLRMPQRTMCNGTLYVIL